MKYLVPQTGDHVLVRGEVRRVESFEGRVFLDDGSWIYLHEIDRIADLGSRHGDFEVVQNAGEWPRIRITE